MNLLYIGSGFVGTCSGAVSAAGGHTVRIFDIDTNKINLLSSGDHKTIESCLYEEGLADLLIRNQERITFTSSYEDVVSFLDTCDAIFMCLPTPEIGETGESDLSYYQKAAKTVSEALVKRNGGSQEKYIAIINKSTVPIEMVDETEKLFTAAGVKNYGVVSNPEFLVEGKAIQGSIKPDRIVVGAWHERDFEIMRQLYNRFYDSPTVEYIEVNPKEAAASKLLANFYLLSKLALCFDVIGRTCELFPDVRFEQIRRVLSTDSRIGEWGLFDSLYAGGSCLTKDTRSLAHQLRERGYDPVLVDSVYSANERQLQRFLARVEECGFSWENKKIALLGTAFKRDTNDTRNAPSLKIADFLLTKQVREVRVYDPAASSVFLKQYTQPQFTLATTEEEAIDGADIIILATDWPQFRGLGSVLMNRSERPLILDGRRILQQQYTELEKAGFHIISVGSTFI